MAIADRIDASYAIRKTASIVVRSMHAQSNFQKKEEKHLKTS